MQGCPVCPLKVFRTAVHMSALLLAARFSVSQICIAIHRSAFFVLNEAQNR